MKDPRRVDSVAVADEDVHNQPKAAIIATAITKSRPAAASDGPFRMDTNIDLTLDFAFTGSKFIV